MISKVFQSCCSSPWLEYTLLKNSDNPAEGKVLKFNTELYRMNSLFRVWQTGAQDFSQEFKHLNQDISKGSSR